MEQRYDAVEVAGLPHLSHSRISKYLVCPEQYRLHYIEQFRPKMPSATLEFGKAVHAALAAHFAADLDPVHVFSEVWKIRAESPLRFSYREDWEKLYERGRKLLETFVAEHRQRISNVSFSENAFELAVSNLDVPFVGVIDLVADVDGKRTVVDFKTAGSAYQEFEVALTDQLTAYHLAVPDARRNALCVLVKTKEPRIEWFFSERSGADFTDYLRKVALIGRRIAHGEFYKHPGKWCSYCDFLPICLGDAQRAKEMLVQAA